MFVGDAAIGVPLDGGFVMCDVRSYEAMAMFELSEEEREMLGARFADLENSFAALEPIDTDGVKPLVTVLDLHSVLREDIAGKPFTREEILANAPEQSDGYFQVPGTLE